MPEKQKIMIYGASESGEKLFREFTTAPNNENYEVIAFIDSRQTAWGEKIGGTTVISPNDICQIDYDKIIIGSIRGKYEIFELLLNLGISIDKIDISHIDYFHKARELFLLYQSEIIYNNNLQGSVAELGVYKGDFARFINGCFPDRKLYLFDTFCGHSDIDFSADEQKNIKSTLGSDYSNTSVETIKSMLPHPENAVFKVGYFPETAVDINDEFVFVNIDVNLYTPTLAGLEYFYPKLVQGGVILCHDFFSEKVEPGVHIAVNEFCAKRDLHYMAIGDRMSIAIIRS